QLLRREREESLQAIEQTHLALQQEETLLTTLDAEEKSLQESIHTQDATLQELRQATQSHQGLVSQLRLEAETTRERLLGKEREEESIRREFTTLEQRLDQDRTALAENVTRMEQLAALQQEKSLALEAMKTTKDKRQKSLTALLDQRQQVQDKLHQLDQALAECRDILTTEQARVQEIEFQSRSVEQDRQRVELLLQETYQLSMDEARSNSRRVRPDAEEAPRLKRRLESLGPVNLAAPQEHAQLEERYHFLLTQQQDLLKAKDDLHQAIGKTNATTRDQFKATFTEVRKNFQMLYQTLFQGGEADVILTD